jgi:hypothetical protein
MLRERAGGGSASAGFGLSNVDWETVLSLGALSVAVLAALSRVLDKSLSIREHNEFKDRVIKLIDDNLGRVERELDKLEDRLKVIEQTRPTTGELEARLGKRNN